MRLWPVTVLGVQTDLSSSALTQAHPDRTIKTTVVRTTVEGLVARSHAHRTKQGSSVFYTAAAPRLERQRTGARRRAAVRGRRVPRTPG